MTIEISQIVALHEIGKREKNEDAIYPALGQATEKSRLFLVCDGMGGHGNGELASNQIAKAMGESLDNLASVSSEECINTALKEAKEQLNQYVTAHPGTFGMGTTLAMIHLHFQGVSVAHIGDSRVYQIRDGKIIFQTEDHKWINKLIKSGQLSLEEAENHPKRNVLSRAIQAGDLTDVQVEYTHLYDIQTNDLFFICSDGILESLSNAVLEDLCEINTDDNAAIIRKIRERCEETSRDNFSAYLIKIQQVDGGVDAIDNSRLQDQDEGRPDIIEAELVYDEVSKLSTSPIMYTATPTIHYETQAPSAPQKYNSFQIWSMILVALMVISTIGLSIYKYNTDPPKKGKVEDLHKTPPNLNKMPGPGIPLKEQKPILKDSSNKVKVPLV